MSGMHVTPPGLPSSRPAWRRNAPELIDGLTAAIDERQDYAAAARLVRQLMFIEKFRDEVKSAADTLAHPREAQS